MKLTLRPALLLLSFVLAATVRDASAQDENAGDLGVQPFVGTYSVQYRGIRAGTIDFILRKSARGYVYESVAHPRGLARLVVDDKVREASEFAVQDGRVVPQSYELDDGTKDTDQDTRLTFDWSSMKARGSHEDRAIELPLAEGVQDRMSAQIVVMQSLAAGRPFDSITFIDRDALKEYMYKRERTERIKTALGEIETVVYSSSRPGSNRVSRLWYAPSLGYAPVRGEQERKGKIETIFEVVKIQR